MPHLRQNSEVSTKVLHHKVSGIIRGGSEVKCEVLGHCRLHLVKESTVDRYNCPAHRPCSWNTDTPSGRVLGEPLPYWVRGVLGVQSELQCLRPRLATPMDKRLVLFVVSGVLMAVVSGVLPWFFEDILKLSRSVDGRQQYNNRWYLIQGGCAGFTIALFLILYTLLRRPPIPEGLVITRTVIKWMTIVMVFSWVTVVALAPVGEVREVIQICVLHLLLWCAVSWALLAKLELELVCDSEEDLEYSQQALLLRPSYYSFISIESDL